MTQYAELKGNALRAYEAMVDKLRRKAMQELRLSPDQIVTRPLRPIDVGLSTPDWYFANSGNSSSAFGSGADISGDTIANARFVGINGFFNTTVASSLHAIRITREGAVAREWLTHQVPYNKHAACWVDDPITLDRNTTVTLEFYQGITGTINNTFGLLGAVCEKRGLLINP